MAASVLLTQFRLAESRFLRDTAFMYIGALIPVSEYLSASYEHDCDYIDGELQERSLGETSHSYLQLILAAIFHANRHAWKVLAGPEQRVKVGPTRYRVPDICVIRRSDPVTEIIQKAPLLCIEVLSPEDRMQRVQERVEDYARMGVEHIWLLDPVRRQAWIMAAGGSQTPVTTEFTVPGTPIRISLAEIFAELDDMQTGS
jgi:Uma2 family endonuclease